MSVYQRIVSSFTGYFEGLLVLVCGICMLYLSLVFLFFSHVAMGLLLLVLVGRVLYKCGL